VASARPDRFVLLLLPWIAIIVGLLLFAGLTVTYVTLSVDISQHRWCATLTLLNSAPAPAGPAKANPSRAYEQELAADFKVLKASLGC
jgi:hypothetical protein